MEPIHRAGTGQIHCSWDLDWFRQDANASDVSSKLLPRLFHQPVCLEGCKSLKSEKLLIQNVWIQHTPRSLLSSWFKPSMQSNESDAFGIVRQLRRLLAKQNPESVLQISGQTFSAIPFLFSLLVVDIQWIVVLYGIHTYRALNNRHRNPFSSAKTSL